MGAMAGEDCGQETNTHYRQSLGVFIEIKGMGGGKKEGERGRERERGRKSCLLRELAKRKRGEVGGACLLEDPFAPAVQTRPLG